MTLGLTLAESTLLIGAATLTVAVTTLLLNIIWRRRSGWANLAPERYRVYENPNAPAGWQLEVDFRNTRSAPAYEPSIWIADVNGASLTDRGHERWSRDVIPPGSRFSPRIDLPNPPQRPQEHSDWMTDLVSARNFGTTSVWVGWRDARGPQERDTKICV